MGPRHLFCYMLHRNVWSASELAGQGPRARAHLDGPLSIFISQKAGSSRSDVYATSRFVVTFPVSGTPYRQHRSWSSKSRFGVRDDHVHTLFGFGLHDRYHPSWLDTAGTNSSH